jgi:pyruvate formate lyase activating enzyme
VRGSKNNKPIIPFYGFTSALALDPVEKKPLYHFKPGSQILSVGFTGCSLRCPFCQNWHISQNTGINGKYAKPGEIVSAALRANSPSIAYTYSEPLVHIEFLLDCMEQARRQGIANVLVTNGCVNSEAAKEILTLTDAANIDLKSFSAETYAQVLGGDLDTVLEFIRLAYRTGVHIELTTLVVPGLNDSEAELDACADFIAKLCDTSDLPEARWSLTQKGKLRGTSDLSEVPWHLSAYHPDYRWNAPPTEPAFLLRTAERTRKKLRYVYTGNIADEANDTVCLHCGAVLVKRRGYRVDASGLAAPAEGERNCRCAKCGEKTPLVC